MVRTSIILITCSAIMCASFLFCNAFSQNNVLSNIENDFDNYRRNTLQEKVFVHTDKNSYLAGEILWFKLYNVDATFHKPLDVSKVAYIELLDAANKPVLQAKIALKQGNGNGSLFIPFTINSGKYKLRAYTNWMKNFDVNYFFEKNISVVNTQKTYETDNLKPLQYDVQFFPEGGNLVGNIQSKVAFKVSDQHGQSIGYNGIVVNENYDTIVKFQPLKFGMGNFIFTPSDDHTYKAIIQTTNGDTITKELPQVYKEGYVLNVINGNDAITINVKTNIAQPQETYLFVHAGETVQAAEHLLIQNGSASFTINKNKLGDGISHITLFNEAKQPVCERLYFKSPSKILELSVHTDEKEYATRKKVDLAITSIDETKKNVTANLSVAVYRFDSLQTTGEENINSYLWLSSDLNGKIESPAYYFSSAATQEETDNLMLTHGWRRFKWETILSDKTPVFKFAPEYNGHIVSGKTIDTRTNAPAKNITAYLSVPGLHTQFANCVSNDSGEVKFELKNFYNSSELIAQTKGQTDNFYRVDISNPFSENYTADLLPPYTLPQYPNTLKTQNLSVQVQNVYTGNKINQFTIPSLDTTAFYYSPDQRYYLDDYTRFTTMEEVLREYVAMVDVRKKGKNFHLAAANENTRRFFDGDPLILLDGVPVLDIDKFMNFDPLKIKKLEVVNRRYFSGASFFEGILNWTTYNGDLANFELDPQATIIDYEALQLQREFYSPVYETEEQKANHLPDFRNVLFWSSNITTVEGKQQLSFYSSDLPGKYVVVLQGIINDGKSGYSETTFDVRK
ncbi:MAG TPA: hypothetical protein VH396_11265 [Chitinophagaceae bacterium]